MNQEDVVTGLAALAHPLRLQVFRALAVSGGSGLTPGVMQDGLGVPAATLSFHLKELADAGLVSQSRQGRHLVYRIDDGRIETLLAYLNDECQPRVDR